jgi:hypothetical protein
MNRLANMTDPDDRRAQARQAARPNLPAMPEGIVQPNFAALIPQVHIPPHILAPPNFNDPFLPHNQNLGAHIAELRAMAQAIPAPIPPRGRGRGRAVAQPPPVNLDAALADFRERHEREREQADQILGEQRERRRREELARLLEQEREEALRREAQALGEERERREQLARVLEQEREAQEVPYVANPAGFNEEVQNWRNEREENVNLGADEDGEGGDEEQDEELDNLREIVPQPQV